MPSQMDYKLCFKMFCSTFTELLEMVMPLIPTEDTIMRECYSTSETKRYTVSMSVLHVA